jgi:hypothetical protein
MFQTRRGAQCSGSALIVLFLGLQACIPTQSCEEQIKKAVANVRAGKKLRPKVWPNGARLAVGLSFDVGLRQNSLSVPLSQGEYGATTGLPRVLAVLARQNIPLVLHSRHESDVAPTNDHGCSKKSRQRNRSAWLGT